MDDQRLTRAYLETLATDDLVALADRLGLDLPVSLNRMFMIEELLDANDEDEDEGPEDELLGEEKPRETEVLPPNYNETFVGVLLRDPLWAYAFWEVKNADRQNYEARDDFSGYRLRVTSLSPSRQTPDGSSFSITVGSDDSSWYLCLPAGVAIYRVDLCALVGRNEEILASSVPFKVPRGRVSPKVSASASGVPEILSLSGLNELRVLQDGDRQSRIPQHSKN